MSKYTGQVFFFGDRTFTALNAGKCMLRLQSWQPTITFHNLPRERGAQG